MDWDVLSCTPSTTLSISARSSDNCRSDCCVSLRLFGMETVPCASSHWTHRTDHSLQAAHRAEVVLPSSKEQLYRWRTGLSGPSLAVGASPLVCFFHCKSPVWVLAVLRVGMRVVHMSLGPCCFPWFCSCVHDCISPESRWSKET